MRSVSYTHLDVYKRQAYDLANGKYTAQDATTAQKGIVQLSSATNSTSEMLAATPKSVKAAYEMCIRDRIAYVAQLQRSGDEAGALQAANDIATKGFDEQTLSLIHI